jgi:hypothetical protein
LSQGTLIFSRAMKKGWKVRSKAVVGFQETAQATVLEIFL